MREGEALRKGRRQADHRRVREDLFRAYYSGVLAFVLSQVDHLETAKRITADSFAAVLDVPAHAPATFEPRVALFSHALLAIDVECKLGRIAPQGSGPAAARGPAHLRQVDACVRRLATRERGVISLRFDAGLSCREIGLIMGMNEVEVMVAVLRSLRRIKACMEAAASRSPRQGRKPARPAPASN
jgi:DNA-directed RNA polymerase specialized sigma24 family protein